MTREDAQKIVHDNGFAWIVVDVVEGDRYSLIYCDWFGTEHIMYYSNSLLRVSSIY